MLSVKQGDIKYHFLSLWYETRSPGPLPNTNSPNMTLIYFNALSGKRDYFYWFREIFHHHRIVVSLKIEFEFKGVLVSFLPSLILFQLPQTKKVQLVNEVRKRKRSQIRNSEFPNKSTIRRQPTTTNKNLLHKPHNCLFNKRDSLPLSLSLSLIVILTSAQKSDVSNVFLPNPLHVQDAT